MTIANIDSLNKALAALERGPRGVRKPGSTSLSVMKPHDVAAVFAQDAPFELHASRTSGRMKDRIWVYANGVLDYEGVHPDICARVIAWADEI